MKLALRLIWALSVFATITLNAQVRKIVLLEEATNASCGPCAANNPKLQDFFRHYFGGVVSVRYHAWWPGTDPMYSLNQNENRDRIQYYSISGVPNYLMDGTDEGVPSSPAAMFQQMKTGLAKGSPVKIIVAKSLDADSIYANVKIKAYGDLSGSNLKLRVAVIERLVEYSSPPGANGEKEFPDVMRKFLTTTDGILLSSMSSGDSLEFSFSTDLWSEWDSTDLEVVAWIQNDTNKEVIQAGISLPTFIIDAKSPAATFLELNQEYSYEYTIKNDNDSQLNLSIYFDKLSKPEDWSIQMKYNSVLQDTLTLSVNPGDSVSFNLVLNTSSTPGSCEIMLKAANADDPYLYGYSVGLFGIVPGGEILFVDDDGGAQYDIYYKNILNDLGVSYTSIPQDYLNDMLGGSASSVSFNTVIWSVGWGFPAFVNTDIDFLVSHLNNGGNLFVAGQDIGWDIYEGSSNSKKIRDFYEKYLDANYVSDNANVFSVQGIAGDPITDGISFNISTVYDRYPESIKSNTGKSHPILKYTNSSKYAALAYDQGTYKTVYLGIGLEQITQADQRAKLLENILIWFGDLTGVEKYSEEIPTKFTLEQNYPNPFNPTTIIKFSIPSDGLSKKITTLKVYDILGKEVATLVQDNLSAGNYEVEFNASNLSSGIYLYTLTSGSYTETKKLMLLK
ncbi:MAG: T9SS C-terminal target domain-containing protein [Ignavibacteria bacterium]|nr:MAG: T9SS C-terminal target domain-containing protein [Ignavibacteria bacterium]